MNIGEQIISVLDNLCQRFGMVIDWGSANVVPYLEELAGRFIQWEISTSWMWIIISGMFLLLGIFFMIYEVKNVYPSDGWMFILGMAFTIIGIIIIGAQVYDIITAIHFPEKTIYEYITYQIDLHK